MKWLNSLFKIENKCLNHVVMNIFYDRTGIYRKQRITALNIHGLELTAFKIRFYSLAHLPRQLNCRDSGVSTSPESHPW